MASLLDQFNSLSVQSPTNTTADMSGYISMSNETNQKPIFSKKKMNIQLPQDITHLAICNKHLVLTMANNVIFRMHMGDLTDDEVRMEQYLAGLRIENMFLDPTGAHLLISLTPKSTQFAPELMYLHKSQKRPKKIDKFRDHEITAVAFNYENTSEASTGPILLGTSKGLIFESEFAVEGERPVQNNWRQLPTYLPLYSREIEGLVFDIGRNERIPITGLEFFRVPGSNKYVVMAAGPDRLYRFQETVRSDERSPFQAIFRASLAESTESPKGHFSPSKAPSQLMRTCYDYSQHFARSMAILTASDILYGEMDAYADTLANILDTTAVPFPERQTEDGQRSRKVSPVAFTLTDFHAVLVYPDHVVAISLLDYSIVYEEYFSERFGALLDVVRDHKTGAVYVYSTKMVFLLLVANERRHVWRIYMELGRLDRALQYAGDNPRYKDIVLNRTAETKFNSGLYLEAAHLYAETTTSFEGVCLKFLELEEIDALMVFLKRKLMRLPAKDSTQITMLVVWLVELFLTQIGRHADSARVASLQADFDEFMKLDRVIECTKNNRSVIYDLMASHGDCRNLTALTAVNSDFEATINQFIHTQKWPEALKVLRAQKRPELFYRFGPILMEAVPKDTVSALMEQREALEPVKLLPTLVCLDSPAHIKEVLRYLEFSVHSLGTADMAVHNYLIRLFAEHQKDKLTTYLETEGKDLSQIHYDRQYALRVCKKWDCFQACVFLQCLLGLWKEAVQLALDFVDVELAQKTAALPGDLGLRRKLWLAIAEHQIRVKKVDVEGALRLLKACPLLRIEDILPYFDDFEKIDHFKAAICDALHEYNQQIQEQKKDMEEAAKSAERVRQDLQSFRERSLTIGVNDLCGSCAIYVLQRPCYVFPCGHKFHMDCLERELLALQKRGGVKLAALKQKMHVAAEGTADLAKVRAEYDDLLASECLHCGQAMIEALDQPFVEDWDRMNGDW